MLRIRIRDLHRDLGNAVSAARLLNSNLDADETVFLKSAWGLGEALHRIGSEPLSYLLNPSPNRRYEKEAAFFSSRRLPESTLDALYEFHDAIRQTADQYAIELRKLVASRLGKIASPSKRSIGPEREWASTYLTTMQYPGTLPTSMIQTGRLHLAGYFALHMGDLERLADEAIAQPDFHSLPRFWQGFYRWHANKDRTNSDAHLLATTLDPREKAGTRKAALLLLWHKSEIPIKKLIGITQNLPVLFEATVQYRGSPPLPVSLLERIPKQISPNVQEMVELAKPYQSVEELTGTIRQCIKRVFGATPCPTPLQEQAERVSAPSLRAWVSGGTEKRRIAIMRLLAAMSGKARQDWRAWSSLIARKKYKSLKADIVQWQMRQSNWGTELKDLVGRALFMCEIQKWASPCVDLISELLREPVDQEPVWADPIIASIDRGLDRPSKDPALRTFFARISVGIDLDEDPDSPEWMPRYRQISIRKLVKLTGIKKWYFEGPLRKQKIDGYPVCRVFDGQMFVLHEWLDDRKVSPSKRGRKPRNSGSSK